MLFAKVLLTLGVILLHAVMAWACYGAWQALQWWAFALGLMVYLPPATWLLFVAGMAIDRAEEAGILPELSAYLAKLLWPMAAVHNFLNNVLPMTLVFVDLPREQATTKRMNRYVDGADGWRKRLALAIREQLLNVFDWRGIHT